MKGAPVLLLQLALKRILEQQLGDVDLQYIGNFISSSNSLGW
jgi:hypothetical protein